jgi:hypothetical protein
MCHNSILTLHCEKSLFALASRKKIPLLRTENPTVDTRTISLPPIEFFTILRARKVMAGNSRPVTTDVAGKSQPSGSWRETFYIPSCPKNYGRKIHASNYRYGR